MTLAGANRRLRYHLRLLGGQLRMSVLTALQHRLGFWTDGLMSLAWSLIGMAPLLVAVGHLDAVEGWSRGELLVLAGCFTAVNGLFGTFVQPALLASMTHVRLGTLDHVLLRPADALVLCMIADFAPWRLVEVLGGLALVVGGFHHLGRAPSADALLWAGAAGLAGIVALVAFGALALCASFRAVRLQNLVALMDALLDLGRWPAQVFRGALRVVFTFVVPLAVMITYPAEALVGRLRPATLGVAVLTSAGSLLVARLLWIRCLRGYTSASS